MREHSPLRNRRAQTMHDGLVGESVKPEAHYSLLEIALRQWKMGRNFGHRVVKGRVETGKVRNLREDLLSLLYERQGKGDVQRREVFGGSELIENGRSQQLMVPEMRAAMNNAVSDRNRGCAEVFVECGRERTQRIWLRFEYRRLFPKYGPIGCSNTEASGLAPDAFSTP